ncbi:MAG: sugar phosphate isomerase/epimerase [Proteobacteria bacterium]|nr:sugar phosphate isomerase/epimerase [Pseudomonadota bacterium]
MQKLEVFQSIWAMERRRPDGVEWSMPEKFRLVAEGGYDGMSIDMASRDIPTLEEARPLLADHGLQNILVAFPNTLEELKPVFDMAGELSSRFVAINAKVFPFTPQEGAQFVRSALELAASMGVEAHFELHRFTLTNDLFYTAQVMDLVPEMEIVADLSHAVVSREIMLPLDDLHADLFHKVVDRAAGLQGRVASREQAQVSITWEQHRPWVELFEGWWLRAMQKWRARKPEHAILNFLCELGPPPYGITGEDGYELVDRWEQGLMLKERARALWAQSEAA